MIALFNRFEIEMTKKQAQSVSHSGDCLADVKKLLKEKKIRKQVENLDPVILKEELKDYGSWDDVELEDMEANYQRIVWLAGGNIIDDIKR